MSGNTTGNKDTSAKDFDRIFLIKQNYVFLMFLIENAE